MKFVLPMGWHFANRQAVGGVHLAETSLNATGVPALKLHLPQQQGVAHADTTQHFSNRNAWAGRCRLPESWTYIH
jgi:hypothetical protein